MPTFPNGSVDMGVEAQGRRCDECRIVTRLVLLSPGSRIPGGWLLLLAAVCCYVLTRSLEAGRF